MPDRQPPPVRNPSHRRRARRARRIAWLSALFAGLAPLAPATPGEASRTAFEDPPRLYVESIEVRGAERISPELVISETRLAPGAFYSEAELLEAAWRVRRLPFVLDASFALARGSERGQLRLIVHVEEVRRFFFGGEALLSRFGRDLALEETFPSDASARFAPAVGARFFTDDFGVVFVAAHGNAVQAGYTRYRLFGRRAFLSVGVERSACCPVAVPPLGLDPTFSSWSSDEDAERATVTLGLPLGTGNRSLRLLASYREAGAGRRRPVLGPPAGRAAGEVTSLRGFSDRKLELAWISDTTDDPLLPTRGRNFTAALELRELEAEVDERPRAMSSRLLRASLSATAHRPIGRRQTVSATLRLAAGRSRIDGGMLPDLAPGAEDLDVLEGTVSFRHGFAVWHSPAHLPARELWWENAVEVGYEDVSPGLALPHLPLRRYSVTSGLTYRSAWGVLRVGISFVDVGRVL